MTNPLPAAESGDNIARQGVFIAIEGTDGSGKGTQYKLLKERLETQRYEVEAFDFPRYNEPSSHFVKKYLNGDYGSLDEIGPYTAALFYALDRYEAAPKIKQALKDGKVVLANRFTGSSMAHQGSKFNNSEQRRGYFIWLDNLEFQMLGIPRPTRSFVLRVPAETAQSLVDKKDSRDYTDKKRDIHEANLTHLQKSVDVYDDLTQLFPKDFERIDCVRSNQLLDVDTIQKMIWEKIEPMLPLKPTKKLTDDVKYVVKNNGIWEITEQGHEFLKGAVTNSNDNVYAFTGEKITPMTAAAAMARLSRRGDDMRITILDEFAKNLGKDEKLLQRVITAFGDDSVQQLVGQHLVVEDASNLLTKKLEWGRLASYLEQSTRYIYFDQKDKSGQYKYFTPSNLDDTTKSDYVTAMDEIFNTYSELVHNLTDYVEQTSNTPKEERDGAWKGATRAQACDAARPLLPVATKATVGIFASGQALENLIMHLLSDELLEARQTGQKILNETRKVIPTFLERADKPDRGGATIAYRANTYDAMKAIASEHLPENYSMETDAVRLSGFWPKNELDLVPEMLYEHSSLPLAEIRNEVAKWPYERREQAFKAYMGDRLNRRHRPGRALEIAHYSWDLVCDYGIFRDLQRHRMVDDMEWQLLTPRYGYDIPELVEKAGLSDLFEKCFDISLALNSKLQAAGYNLEAQYATLLGHKMRWKVTYNAREAFHLHELRTTPQGHPGYRKLVRQMHEKLEEVHPIMAESMKFVNQGEDPELTRLAAEKYTQFKLQQMGQD